MYKHCIYGLAVILTACGAMPKMPEPTKTAIMAPTKQDMRDIDSIKCMPSTEMAMSLSLLLRNRPYLTIKAVEKLSAKCPNNAIIIAQEAIRINPGQKQNIVLIIFGDLPKSK